jgi:hypothetical protein
MQKGSDTLRVTGPACELGSLATVV